MDGAVTINTRGIQEWTVPTNGNYSIEAYGAEGGGIYGGLGAKIKGVFSLNSGTTLKILVGQSGLEDGNLSSGGGGTFVIQPPYDNNSSILVIAGGGGGAKDLENNQSITAGSVDLNGTRGMSSTASGNNENTTAGGVNGFGGSINIGDNSTWGGGKGGGGFFGDGGGYDQGGGAFLFESWIRR